MLYRSEPQRFVAWGDLGLFTRPAFRSDRVTQPFIPPTAAEGIVKSIFWHPEAKIHEGEKNRLGVEILELQALSPIQTIRMRKNEIKECPKRDNPYDVVQRQTSLVLLKDPKYLIQFTYVSTDRMIPKKAAEIFKRRLSKGQCFQQPCFGRRRYVAFFREATAEDQPLPIDQDLGKFPWRIEYPKRGKHTQMELHTFDAKLEGGVLQVPSYFDSCVEQGREVQL